MKIFSEKKEFNIGNRSLIIINKTHLPSEIINKITNEIISEFKKEDLYKELRRLVVHLYESKHKPKQKYKLEVDQNYPMIDKKKKEWFNGNGNFHNIKIDCKNLLLFIDMLNNIEWKKLANDLKRTLYHETVHLLHYRRSKSDQFIKKRQKDINKYFKRENNDIYCIRHMITGIFHKIWIEGLARFKEEIYSQKLKMTLADFRKTYSQSKKKSSELKELIKENFKKIKCQKDIDLSKFLEFQIIQCYDIGKHMFHAVHLFNPGIEEKIFKLDMYSFIKTYEKSMLKQGYKPIVSLHSKKGIVDYKEMIKDLNDIRKEGS